MNWKSALCWILFVSFLLFWIINYSMHEIEINNCRETLEKLNISRCDNVEVIHTILPFTWSTECYCENFDRIYFDMKG